MIRFWAFAVFVTIFAASSPGGLKRVISTSMPGLQSLRGLRLVSEIIVVVISFTTAGLAMSQAIMQSTPLIVTILSVGLSGSVAIVFFYETLTANMIVGSVIVIGAGLFTIWRE